MGVWKKFGIKNNFSSTPPSNLNYDWSLTCFPNLSQIRSTYLVTINSTPSATHFPSKSLVWELFWVTSCSLFTSLRNIAVLLGARLSGEAAKTHAKRAVARANCSRPNLLAVSLPLPVWVFSAPNQNRHAMQASSSDKWSHWVLSKNKKKELWKKLFWETSSTYL